MADFCKQCSSKIFGEDFEDLKGLGKEGDTVSVICEGCGFTVVNHAGECISEHCIMRHGVKKDG